jgi:hypothetical protein
MEVCPKYVDMTLLRQLFPTYADASIWRLNTAAGGPNRLPPYDLVFGDTSLWELETILDWAKASGRLGKIDREVLAQICQ